MKTSYNATSQPNGANTTHFDAVVVGVGFGGMYMLHTRDFRYGNHACGS
jgi:hypothetical protein